MRIRFDSPLRNMLRLGWDGFGLEEQCIKRFCKSVDGLSALLNLWRTASGECMTRRDINVDGVRGSKFERVVERIDGEFGHCMLDFVIGRSCWRFNEENKKYGKRERREKLTEKWREKNKKHTKIQLTKHTKIPFWRLLLWFFHGAHGHWPIRNRAPYGTGRRVLSGWPIYHFMTKYNKSITTLHDIQGLED